MIELNGVSKKYGENFAVRQASFNVAEEENLILLGTSGCGKTTTLKMINRLIEPNAGEIKINGEAINDLNPEILRRKIGYVMQNIGLFPHYTIGENIAVVPNLLKWNKAKIDERIHELIAKLHLPDNCLKLFPNELSGGQQQRVGLARALIANPPILLMDEPFGALDNVTRASIQLEFKQLDELKRKTIVMVTHDVEEAFELADRICLMDKGEVMQIGTPKDLLYKPANDFVSKFLDGQRLALEFKVVTINDIWGHLNLTSGSNLNHIDSGSSIWHAMEQLRLGKDNEILFSNEKNELKSAGFEELTKAFNLYKNSTQHD